MQDVSARVDDGLPMDHIHWQRLLGVENEELQVVGRLVTVVARARMHAAADHFAKVFAAARDALEHDGRAFLASLYFIEPSVRVVSVLGHVHAFGMITKETCTQANVCERKDTHQPGSAHLRRPELHISHTDGRSVLAQMSGMVS